ncbi:hypothetical protein [Massilia cavernae]|uniref:hypothetical protein n=1 Tax=Massilia cavernae TaxID=2320864 RepID=UPI00160001EF
MNFGALVDAGYGVVSAQILYFLNANPILFFAYGKGEKFQATANGTPGGFPEAIGFGQTACRMHKHSLLVFQSRMDSCQTPVKADLPG